MLKLNLQTYYSCRNWIPERIKLNKYQNKVTKMSATVVPYQLIVIIKYMVF